MGIRRVSIVLALSLLSTSLAHATYYGCDSDYYVTANYSGQADGKSVISVLVHAGVLETQLNEQTQASTQYWASVIDQPMTAVDGHFFAKFKVSGTRGGGDGPMDLSNGGAVIQYFVVFTDGSAVTQPAVNSVPVINSFGASEPASLFQSALAAFTAQSDASSTSAIEYHSGSGCPN